MDIPIQAPVRWITENVARNPLLSALLTATGGYLGGKYLAAPAVSWLSGDEDEEAKKDRASRFGLAGGLAGLVPPALISWGRMSRTAPHSADSIAENPSLRYKRYPAGEGVWDALTRNFSKAPAAPVEPPVSPETIPFSSGEFRKGSSNKRAAYDVPVQPGVSNLVLTDPYLQPYEKALVLETIRKAREEQAAGPLVTTGDLVRGASQAGFGYVGARLLGSVLGLGFGMSPKNQQRLGLAGAIANVLTSIGAR